jgi:hypothetical protein
VQIKQAIRKSNDKVNGKRNTRADEKAAHLLHLVVSGTLARAEAFHVQPFADERFRRNPGYLGGEK